MKNQNETKETTTLLTLAEARYLKHMGEINDVKITIGIVGLAPVIYIRDTEFHSFSRALVCLQHIVENEIVTARQLEVA